MSDLSKLTIASARDALRDGEIAGGDGNTVQKFGET